ncbi:hypothetical protein ACQKMV_05140 [Lysinibacillus sp. NPDC094403]|uniref:hypothetical protein n=1 Tax=Lysinibacillus sp. NPDC094403 TaxID=3390581 RepID=UPI003D00284B
MYEHKTKNKVLCICEGNAEKEIMRLLMEHGLLKFTIDDLIDNDFLTGTNRKAKNIETRFLGQTYNEGQLIEIIRITDSKRENFKINKDFNHKIEGITNCFTRPEIEILIIIHEGHYDKFSKQKSHIKPSIYCETNFKNCKNIKQQGFILDYFSNIDDLVKALKKYDEICSDKKGETIFSLLKI